MLLTGPEALIIISKILCLIQSGAAHQGTDYELRQRRTDR